LIGGIARPNPLVDELPMGAERGADFGDIFSGGSFVENIQITLAKILNINLPYESGVGSIFRYFLNALEGAASLIGLDIDDFAGDTATLSSGLGNFVEVILNLSFASGYYLVLIRSICRDLSLVGQAANDIGSPLGFVDFINKMRDARIVRVTDSCASIGERNRQKRRNAQNNSSIRPSEPLLDKPIEEVDPSRSSLRVSRSRVEKGKKTLAWSHTEIASMGIELISSETMQLIKKSSINPIGYKSSTRMQSTSTALSNARIPDDTRKSIEDALDSEYMPFYFHDLRTNEILAFHAFLESLTDGFSATYTQSTGFGRMDPVQTYGSTTRAVSFSFNLVSTSPEDFDQMWYSINKLVNMCYPQWSEGNLIEDQNNRFIQPFSQVISASPMIRVRIGDVIHSNYDRFGLARIFGLGRADIKISGKGDENTARAASLDKIVNSEEYKELTVSPSDKASLVVYNAILATFPRSIVYKTGADNYAWYSLTTADIADVVAKGIIDKKTETKGGLEFSTVAYPSLIKGDDKLGIDTIREGDVVAFIPNTKDTTAPAKILVKAKGTTWTKIPSGGVTQTSTTHPYQLINADQILRKTEVEGSYLEDQAVQQLDSAINEFMDPTKNPIVRSFEQASGGRGLAGFITRIGFDWNESTWDTDKGRRAPKYLKVDIEFAPVHDLPMGISHDGTARAVAYPAGNYNRQNYFPNLGKKG